MTGQDCTRSVSLGSVQVLYKHFRGVWVVSDHAYFAYLGEGVKNLEKHAYLLECSLIDIFSL